ncbi:hypothetical protein [Nocardia sp. NPDC057668]|uniref:hypothetical protein n=1 Tax=Nocardia sp. NPDC057668 TaxID=3346202 RepID=UPI00366D850E
MNKIFGRLAAGCAVAAAVPLSAGTATAVPGDQPVWLFLDRNADLLSCDATTVACGLNVLVFDMTTPITISVDGKTLVSGAPLPNTVNHGTKHTGTLATTWIPQTAGKHVVSAQQGGESQSMTLTIIGNNSPEAIARRTVNALRPVVCGSGSGTLVGSAVGGCPLDL